MSNSSSSPSSASQEAPESSSPDSSPALLTYEDLAVRWKVSPRSARRAAAHMRVRALRISHRHVRFRLVDVERAESTRTVPIP